MNDAAIRLHDVSLKLGDTRFRFDCEVPRGEICALMGPSGSGKSTMLSLIAGFEMPDSGRVLIEGRDVTALPPAARPLSMVFQENNFFGHLDVAANVGLGRSPRLHLSKQDRDDVSAALDRVGLGGKEKRLPRELSGGERQRVALARVLVRDRPILLLDEPFASLGPALRHDMVSLLCALQAEKGMSVLMATHHPEDAKAAATRIIFLENGAIAATGDTPTFFGPAGPEQFKRYLGHRHSSTPRS